METGAAAPRDGRQKRLALLFAAGGFILLGISAIVGITDNPPAIAAMLVGLVGVALGSVYAVSKPGSQSPGRMLLTWAPRALCIVFALFTGMFALDVFGEGRGVLETAIALLMHLIPTFLMLLVLWVSWRREWIAGVVFPILAVLYIVNTWNAPFAGWGLWLVIPGPMILTGVLFLLSWSQRRKANARGTPLP